MDVFEYPHPSPLPPWGGEGTEKTSSSWQGTVYFRILRGTFFWCILVIGTDVEQKKEHDSHCFGKQGSGSSPLHGELHTDNIPYKLTN